MNTPEEHLEKARRNAEFLAAIPLADDAFCDWAIVVLFYRALHLVSAALHAMGRDHGASHPARGAAVQAAFSSAVTLSYDRLYSRSRLLRYDQLATTLREHSRLLRDDFAPILRAVEDVVPGAA